MLSALALSALISAAPPPAAATYPSCNLAAQRAAPGRVGGSLRDPRQAHIVSRLDVVQSDIESARRARRLTRAQADRLWRRADGVRRQAAAFTRAQGFLSAAERASYDREIDGIAMRICTGR